MSGASRKGLAAAARRFWPLVSLVAVAVLVVGANAWMLHEKKARGGEVESTPAATLPAAPPAVDLPQGTALAGFLAAFGDRIEALEERAAADGERSRTTELALRRQGETLAEVDRTLRELRGSLDAAAGLSHEANERSSSAIDQVRDILREAAAPAAMAPALDVSLLAAASAGPRVARLQRLQWGPVAPAQALAVERAPKRYLQLPAGAFARATLLTGVYAPVTKGEQPLPVLLRLREAFQGPNARRVPLADAFLIGKAVGDANSERAIVELERLSVVLPDGEVFESEVVGYVAAADGQQGLPGRYEWNAERLVPARMAAGGFAGAAEALSEGEATRVVTPAGGVAEVVTGNAGRRAALHGLAAGFEELGAVFQERIAEIGPAIVVENGAEVSVVMLRGTTIEGYEVEEGGGDASIWHTVD
ncbi:MAG: TraB/VirB10 family protein [Planctomycetes bacterium]|nr:TraB/VirB10 family protein [Planctomycetota bacterium]